MVDFDTQKPNSCGCQCQTELSLFHYRNNHIINNIIIRYHKRYPSITPEKYDLSSEIGFWMVTICVKQNLQLCTHGHKHKSSIQKKKIETMQILAKEISCVLINATKNHVSFKIWPGQWEPPVASDQTRLES